MIIIEIVAAVTDTQKMSSDEESINASNEQLTPDTTKDVSEENNARVDSDIAIAVPPKDHYDSEIASSGTSALDVLEQVSSRIVGKCC